MSAVKEYFNVCDMFILKREKSERTNWGYHFLQWIWAKLVVRRMGVDKAKLDKMCVHKANLHKMGVDKPNLDKWM